MHLESGAVCWQGKVGLPYECLQNKKLIDLFPSSLTLLAWTLGLAPPSDDTLSISWIRKASNT